MAVRYLNPWCDQQSRLEREGVLGRWAPPPMKMVLAPQSKRWKRRPKLRRQRRRSYRR
jgi:hypothetical protein